MLKKLARKILAPIRRAALISNNYEIINAEAAQELLSGWQNPVVAQRQHKAFVPLLRQMYDGKPRGDFVALAKAVQKTGRMDALMIEVGCGSGWNLEVLRFLLKCPIHYIGLDYAPRMVALAKEYYRDTPFLSGDATTLPLHDKSCDILISGTVLMHVVNYKKAIHESRRVTREWCIFHTIPVLLKRGTTFMRKNAYGNATPEILFNEKELKQVFEEEGLKIHDAFESIPYNLSAIVGENTTTNTYLCKIHEL